MRITILIIVNIDCVTLNYEFVIGINGRSFEHWNDVIRIRLKRTIWAALKTRINMERIGGRLLQWTSKKLKSSK